MSGRFNPYLLILLGILMAAFLLNAPVAFATKLPTACNLFHEKEINKSGPCGHQALFPNDKTFGNEVLFSSGADSSTSDCLWFQINFSSLSAPSVNILNPAAPLRC
jgi:hypothetical protein